MQSSGKSRRYFFLAVNTGLAEQGVPDERCQAFYRDRSGHGLHCAIVGNVVTPDGVGSNEVCARISDAANWSHLARAITEKGALAGVQLASTWPGYQGMTRFRSKSGIEALRGYRDIAANLSKDDWGRAFDGLARGTELAVKAGFRHIQLHAAHGYLFNLLIDPRLSRYAEASINKIDAWACALSQEGIESSIRFSMFSGEANFDKEDSHKFFDQLTSLSINYLDASAGFYNVDKRLIYPYQKKILEERVATTIELARRHPGINFILSAKSAHAWDMSLDSNIHIGICRDLIANPNWLLERKGGCANRMKCHYYSRGESYLTCGKWNAID